MPNKWLNKVNKSFRKNNKCLENREKVEENRKRQKDLNMKHTATWMNKTFKIYKNFMAFLMILKNYFMWEVVKDRMQAKEFF